MPKRTKEQMLAEIEQLGVLIQWGIDLGLHDGVKMNYIGMVKRRAQVLAVECQRLEDLMDEDIEEAVEQLRKGLEDE
jgi:hypothetical protein